MRLTMLGTMFCLLLSGCSLLQQKDPVKEAVYTPAHELADTQPIVIRDGELAVPIEVEAPKASLITTGGMQYGCFDEEGFRHISAMRIANDANAEALRRTSETLTLRVENRNDLLAVCQKVEQESNGLRQIAVEREKQITDLNRKHTVQIWKERLIAGGLILLSLLAK